MSISRVNYSNLSLRCYPLYGSFSAPRTTRFARCPLTHSLQFEKHILKPTAYFGDRSKANNNIRGATVTALTPVDLIILPDMFHDRNDVRVVYASLSIVNGWQREYVSKLYDQSEHFSYKEGEELPEGHFYIISEGKADGKGPGGVVGWNGGTAGKGGKRL